MAFSLLSHSPAEIIFIIIFGYLLSGYLNVFRENFTIQKKILERKMTDKLIIFDTTLRDGEQSPGASMTQEEKVRIALQLGKAWC